MSTCRTSGLPGQTPRQSRPQQRSPQRSWPVPVGVLVLSAVPLLAGVFRVVQLLGGPELIPADQRFASSPLPLVAHIVGAATYLLVGILQFVPRFRRRHWAWHRRAGRVLAVAGLLVAGSAFWMTLFYAQKPGTGQLLVGLRLVFAAAMTASLVLGVTTIRRGDVAGHRAWMIRAYAIGLAAGTQAFTGGIGPALFGKGVLAGDLSMGAAWVINLAIAEWVIRRSSRSARSTPPDRADRRTTDVGVPS
jgi:uncharacterized membrane protein